MSLGESELADSAELFEAISHPVRIKILKILEKQPAGFGFLKRQLDIESSGNLDHHLKKLGQLITVREDGLYGLTDAGKEALLSIQAIELWREMERRKIKTFEKMPRESFSLALLEFCTAVASVFWFLSAYSTPATAPVIEYFSGFFVFVVVAILGFASAFGIFDGKRWSWKTAIVKSAIIMLTSLIPLYYLSLLLGASQDVSSEISRFYPTGIFYTAFVITEAIAMLVASRRPTRDFLGVKPVTRLSRRALLGGVTTIISGVLTIVGVSMSAFASGPYGAGALDVVGSFVFGGGLAVGIGGVLILLRSYILGALMSIVFCLFPYPAYSSALTVVVRLFGFSLATVAAALVIGLLPIAGGTLALVSMRKILD
jgi:DNA-binding transcriptional ArsR family regulator